MSFRNLCAFHCLTLTGVTLIISESGYFNRSATLKRSEENKELASELNNLENKLKATLSGLDWTILTHQKKLSNLTKNSALPFTHHETVSNLSSYRLSDNELDILKNGLGFSIKPLNPLQLDEA